MSQDPEMPATTAGDGAEDIPDTMPPAGGGTTEAEDQPLGVDPEDDTEEMPGIPEVGEGETAG